MGVVAVAADGDDARYSARLSWTTDHVARVFALGYTDLGMNGRGATEVRTIGGESCLVGPTVGFDVDDQYGYDVDETVTLTVSYVPELTTAQAIVVLYDRNGGDGRGSVEIAPERTGQTVRATVTLPRARLAGQGAQGVDIAIAGRQGTFGICDVGISRSGTTRPPTAFGRVRLEVKDAKSGRVVPARVGLYDETGRLPLPSDQAIPVRRFTDQIRRVWMNRRAFWPVESREAFYVSGAYEARVPAGTYDLVVSRGPEYRLHRQKVTVRADDVSPVAVALARYDDLPARGLVFGRIAPAPAARSGRRPGGVDAGCGRGPPHRPSPRDGQHHGHLLQAAGVGESRPLRAGRRGAGVGPGGSANRRSRPHHALERGAAHPLRARRVLPVSPRVRADPARRRDHRVRAPRRALQRPPRPGPRRAVRPRRLHRAAAGRAHRHRRLVSVPEHGLPDPAGRGRRLAVLRSHAPGRRADLRAGGWSVHDRLVARRLPPWTGLRDQRPAARADRERPADGRGAEGGARGRRSRSRPRPG